MRGTVVVFARTPELNAAKTRLRPALGAHGTLRLYRAFLADTLDLARRAGAEVVLARTKGPSIAEADAADEVLVQEGNGFGERMDFVLSEVARARPKNAPYVIVGADAPHLPPAIVRHALRTLEDASTTAVLGPCQAGGFYLLGFRGPPVAIAAAFDAPGEADRVLSLLARAGRPARRLAEFFDVDTPDDLRRLASYVAAKWPHGDGAWVPPRTRRALDELGWMVPNSPPPTRWDRAAERRRKPAAFRIPSVRDSVLGPRRGRPGRSGTRAVRAR